MEKAKRLLSSSSIIMSHLLLDLARAVPSAVLFWLVPNDSVGADAF